MSTRDMAKKRQRRRDSTESSSSAETAPSKPPKDILGLGQYLVRELGFEDRPNTLGCWMAHHLAELMEEAENGPNAADRSKARKSAIETILKIWEHRTSLPGRAYPLASYNNVLMVLDRMRPNNNPFWYFGQQDELNKEHFAALLFDKLSRLIIALLFMKVPTITKSDTDAAAIKALSKTEQQVLRSIQEWGELFESTEKGTGRVRKSKTGRNSTKKDFNKVAVQLIDSITATLGELRTKLQRDR